MTVCILVLFIRRYISVVRVFVAFRTSYDFLAKEIIDGVKGLADKVTQPTSISAVHVHPIEFLELHGQYMYEYMDMYIHVHVCAIGWFQLHKADLFKGYGGELMRKAGKIRFNAVLSIDHSSAKY